jgi:hypothetical protein
VEILQAVNALCHRCESVSYIILQACNVTLIHISTLFLIMQMDSNRDGIVDFDEFVAATLHIC